MTCRHGPHAPACSSYRGNLAAAQRFVEERSAVSVLTSTSTKVFHIDDFYEAEFALVLRVKYEECDNCAFDSHKIMVYEGKTVRDAIRWRDLDPHFYPPDRSLAAGQAPPPIARFPGSVLGWGLAVDFAKRFSVEKT